MQRKTPRVLWVWVSPITNKLIGPFFFESQNVTWESFKCMLLYYAFPTLLQHPGDKNLNRVVLLLIMLLLCDNIQTKRSQTVGWAEPVSFRGLVGHHLSRFVTTLCGYIWNILCILTSWTQYKMERIEVHTLFAKLTKRFRISSTKTCKVVYSLYWKKKMETLNI